MPQSTSQPSLPPSYPYTPRAAIPTQSSNAYISQPTYSSSTSQYSYPQNQAQAHTEPATNPHGYPYSLLGLHALPATFDPPEVDELPSTSSSNIAARATTSQIPPRAQTHRRAPSDPYNASFSDDNSTVRGVEPTSHLEPEMESILLEQAVPSLGVLDGVLSFIAVERERARNIATREASSTADVEDSRDTGSGDDGEAEAAEGETVEGEEDWKHIVENEPNQPKRKRRRKRPPRSHAAAAAQALIATGGPEAPVLPPNTTGLEGAGAVDLPVSILAAVTASPKRKKKTKSTPASASASTSSSLLSVPLNGDGLLTPTPNKEFLVPPPSLSRSASKNRDKPAFTGLRRPDELLIRSNIPSDDDSDFDGGRTPTNFDVLRAEASHGTEVAVLPINLNGKKGKRVGRREREREKARHDAINAEQELKGGDSMDVAVEENSFEFDFDDDDNDDDGLEPRDEDEEQGEDNDSLSNLSLLKPPRRRRDRSRRRKGRDTTYIHTVTGINGAYKSTPGTPGGHLHPYAIANDGDQFSPDVEIKQSSVEDDDAFEPKINTTPEKRKRTRTKRLKPARSFPDMNVDTLAGGSTAPALAPVLLLKIGRSWLS
ncbi:hypothetical protein BJ912DRAFT_495563 [Pholiota molesta]|nr:hypothetical protein BJ912DRAFT_495563 [Pholiota molesta]